MTSAYHEYIADVLAGAFVTSGKIKKLCAKLKARGDTYKRWHYEQARADHAISFIEAFCCQTAGEIGKKLRLQPFQKFLVSAVFGWIDDDGYREFQEVLVVIGRKAGKLPSVRPSCSTSWSQTASTAPRFTPWHALTLRPLFALAARRR